MDAMFSGFERADWPDAADRAAVARETERVASAAADGDAGAVALTALAATPNGARALGAVFGNSPFLTHCLQRETSFAAELFRDGPDAAFARIHAELVAARARAATGAELATTLRRSRARAALTIALGDIAACWPVERVTASLSGYADTAIGLAVDDQLRALAAGGAIELADAADPARDSGLVVLGMGKLGGGELNYSSDVDLIVLYDEERVRGGDHDTRQKSFVRLVRGVVKLLEERTADGYVLRTDLRLRPDPGATPLAMSTDAAEFYYENMGQNWERAAMIKARPVAGDIDAGNAFLARLKPYVWRRHLDFAAIQDIHSIKRQIHAHRGGGAVTLAGHNIKLGRGGIREIEFFAQTQQLIWGGREPRLRERSTCGALAALLAVERVDREACEDLTRAYRYLRRVEHRLQMIADQQTQTLPSDAAGLANLATFLGEPSPSAFGECMLATLRSVEQHYAHLFEEAPALGGDGGNLVFTGTDDDPGTLETLRELGFRDVSAVAAQVRAWHHGRYRCMRSARARELLTELMPRLLKSIGATASPDAAFLNFDRFLSRMPAGVQLFSLFHANPHLLEFVAEIMGGAPRLADRLSARPQLLDYVLASGLNSELPDGAALAEELAAALGQARDFQDVLDIVRRWKHEREFQVGVRLARGRIAASAAGNALSDIADAALRALKPAVEAEFARAHGVVPGAELAIVGLGKLGGREMTFTSDLDLVLLYDGAEEDGLSNGEKPLATSHYFIRLAARLVNAVTALTPEGRLYEIDMRLRPSGSKGPIAVSLAGFARYNERDAWTWEHMALTRSRVIAASPALARRIERAIIAVLSRPRDDAQLVADIAAMRQLIARERRGAGAWDVKNRRGGLIDIEFIAQYLQLRDGSRHPDIFAANTAAALERAEAAGALTGPDAAVLKRAYALVGTVQSVLRVAVDEPFDPASTPPTLLAGLARAAGAPDFDALAATLDDTCAATHAIFERLILPDAAARGRISAQ
jgi:glutamate-ammonia-ligase adenylyltransferase